MGAALGPVQTRSSEDPAPGPQLIEIDVEVGDQSLAVGGEPVVSIVSPLQCSGREQPIPQFNAAAPGEVVVAGARFRQRGQVAVLAQ